MSHHIIKEIKEEPQAAAYVLKDEHVKELAEAISASERVFLFGCGSSYNMALYGARVAEALEVGVEAYALPSSEFAYFLGKLRRGDLVVAISRSGETSETLKVAMRALKAGVKLFSITNEPESPLAKVSHAYVLMGGGREESVVMTKTFVAGSLSILRALKMCAGGDVSRELPSRLGELIEAHEPLLKDFSKEFAEARLAVNLGHSYTHPMALEASIKVMEAALIPAITYHMMEFRHGPKALVEPGVYVLALLVEDPHYELHIDLLEEVSSLGAKVVLITNREGLGDVVVKIGLKDPLEAAILTITPVHLLVYYSALRKGLDPDRPRHLSKVVKVRGLS